MITILAHAVFVVHGYFQHSGAEWYDTPSLRYDVYLISDTRDLRDVVSFAHGCNFRNVGHPRLTPASMFHIPALSGKTTTVGTVGSTSGKVVDDLQYGCMVSEDSDHDSGYRRVDDNANEDEGDADEENFQVPHDEEIFPGYFSLVISASYSCQTSHS